MSQELFDVPQSLSPKLVWLAKHELITEFDAQLVEGGESPETGDPIFPWLCIPDKATRNGGMVGAVIGYGMTEEEAIYDWCGKTSIPHYTIKP